MDAFQAYRSTRVNTASQGELVLMLFDAAVRHGRAAVSALQERALEEAHTHLIKTQEIVSELMGSLNHEIDLSASLYQLYEYCNHRLIQANVTKDAAEAIPAVDMLAELRATWYEAIKGDRASSAGEQPEDQPSTGATASAPTGANAAPRAGEGTTASPRGRGAAVVRGGIEIAL